MPDKFGELIAATDEDLLPDISFLSSEQQDRYSELADKLLADPSPITAAGVQELDRLLNGLPLIGPYDPFAGPNLEIPDALVFHFKWTEQRGKLPYRYYDFGSLKAVQKVRFGGGN